MMYICRFCNDKKKNANSLRNHERLCKLNENREKSTFENPIIQQKANNNSKSSNQYIKANEIGLKLEMSDKTKEKIRKSNSENAEKVWTKERRENHSKVMKDVVKTNPQSYTSSNRGRTKQIIYNGIKFQGQWELHFYKYCIINNIEVIKPLESFDYEWNGKRQYFPDFYLCKYNIYIEVKGYQTERDLSKWRDFPNKLAIIKEKEISQILKDNFDLIEWLSNTKIYNS